MYAAVVELDALPDAIGPGAQYDDFFLIAGPVLILSFVGQVVVWGAGFELPRAGVYQLDNRLDTQLLPRLPHVVRICFGQHRNLLV